MKYKSMKQSGFTLLELMIVLSVIAFIGVLNLQSKKSEIETDEARFIAQQLAVYNNAVRNHISSNLDNQNYVDNVTTTLVGVNWLKSASQCGGSSDGYYLPCEFPNNIGKTNLTYTTIISADLGEGKLRARTVIDIKNASGTETLIGSTQAGLAVLTANGGRSGDAIVLTLQETEDQVDANGNGTTNILLSGTDAEYLYCPFGLNISLLSNECTTDGATKENGLIVMIVETAGERDSLIRTDGSNTMKNSLSFSSNDALQRKIVGSNAIYNLTGEILKIGNSGVYFDNGWLPVIGDGLVIDTDMVISGNSRILGDVDVAGDIVANTNIILERSLLSKGNIIAEGSSEVVGDQYILGNANYNSDMMAFGTVDATMIKSATFLEGNEISASNNISSNVIVNAPTLRASAGLFSDGEAVVSGDIVSAQNSYVSGARTVGGSVLTGEDLIANTGTSYLNGMFTSVIFDTDGDYLVDLSGITRTNITRAEKIVTSNTGENLNLSSNRVLLAREDVNCNAASEACATSVSGYIDMEKVRIKSPGNGTWIGLIDYLNGLETYVDSQGN